MQNDEFSGKLRRAELLHARVSDELTKYRIAEGKSAMLNFDEEQRLRTKVQVCLSVEYVRSYQSFAICSWTTHHDL